MVVTYQRLNSHTVRVLKDGVPIGTIEQRFIFNATQWGWFSASDTSRSSMAFPFDSIEDVKRHVEELHA
jgi:hypothetical protein